MEDKVLPEDQRNKRSRRGKMEEVQEMDTVEEGASRLKKGNQLPEGQVTIKMIRQRARKRKTVN